MMLDAYHIAILEFFEEKKEASLDDVTHELYHDMPKSIMDNCLNYILKKQLIEEMQEPGKRGFYQLTEIGKRELAIYRQNEARKRQPSQVTNIHAGGHVIHQSSVSAGRDVDLSQSVNATPSKKKSAYNNTS